MKKLLFILISFSFLTLFGCSHEVGSEGWCENLKEKPKGDWSANEATDFTRHCLFK